MEKEDTATRFETNDEHDYDPTGDWMNAWHDYTWQGRAAHHSKAAIVIITQSESQSSIVAGGLAQAKLWGFYSLSTRLDKRPMDHRPSIIKSSSHK